MNQLSVNTAIPKDVSGLPAGDNGLLTGDLLSLGSFDSELIAALQDVTTAKNSMDSMAFNGDQKMLEAPLSMALKQLMGEVHTQNESLDHVNSQADLISGTTEALNQSLVASNEDILANEVRLNTQQIEGELDDESELLPELGSDLNNALSVEGQLHQEVEEEDRNSLMELSNFETEIDDSDHGDDRLLSAFDTETQDQDAEVIVAEVSDLSAPLHLDKNQATTVSTGSIVQQAVVTEKPIRIAQALQHADQHVSQVNQSTVVNSDQSELYSESANYSATIAKIKEGTEVVGDIGLADNDLSPRQTDQNLANKQTLKELVAAIRAAQAVDKPHAVQNSAQVADDLRGMQMLDALEARVNQRQENVDELTSLNRTEGTAKMTISTPVGDNQWSKVFQNRVNFLVQNGIQKAEIKLDPEELGSIDVEIDIVDDVPHIQFNAENSQAKDALDSALPRLREMLSQGGMNEASVDVSSGKKESETDADNENAKNENTQQVASDEESKEKVEVDQTTRNFRTWRLNRLNTYA